ncbi:MAG: TRAP transporter small permease [Devosia sp.]
MGEATDKILAGGTALLARIGGALVLVSAFLVAAEVFMRNLFGLAVLHSFEITIYLFAVAISVSLAHALMRRAHIRIDLVIGHAPRPLAAVLDVAAVIAVAGLALTFAVHAWGVVAHSASLGARSNTTLAVPLVIPQSAWAMGLSLFALTATVLALRLLTLLLRGRFGAVAARAGIPHGVPREASGADDAAR